MDESQEPVMVFDLPINPNENVLESEVLDAAQLFSKANNVGPELLALWNSGQDHVQVNWKHKSIGNISQLET